MVLPPKYQVKKHRCALDYFSMTWAPKQLASKRKLWNLQQKSLHHPNKQFPTWLRENEEKPVLDVLDGDCVKALTEFLVSTMRDIFISSDYTVEDAVEEGFSVHPRNSGLFGYKHSWSLHFNGQQIGLAACGATNGGCYLSFTGAGICLVDSKRLHDSIKDFPALKITRVDVAFDDYDGVFSVKHARKFYKNNLFNAGGTPPKYMYIESGHLKLGRNFKESKMVADGGSSFYVGTRESGKLLRVYEKGKQLGDKSSNWTRWEVEIRSTNREIPLNVLLDPAAIFKGAYPALKFIECYLYDQEPRPIKTKKKATRVEYKRSVASLSRVGAATLNAMRLKGLSDSEIVTSLIGSKTEIPRRLRQIAATHIKQSEPWDGPVCEVSFGGSHAISH